MDGSDSDSALDYNAEYSSLLDSDLPDFGPNDPDYDLDELMVRLDHELPGLSQETPLPHPSMIEQERVSLHFIPKFEPLVDRVKLTARSELANDHMASTTSSVLRKKE